MYWEICLVISQPLDQPLTNQITVLYFILNNDATKIVLNI